MDRYDRPLDCVISLLASRKPRLRTGVPAWRLCRVPPRRVVRFSWVNRGHGEGSAARGERCCAWVGGGLGLGEAGDGGLGLLGESYQAEILVNSQRRAQVVFGLVGC